MSELPRVSLWRMILCLSEASDLINPLVVHHQKRVAYIVSQLAAEMALSDTDMADVMTAAALHDIGVFSLHERMETLKFDYVEGVVPHAVAGYSLLQRFAPLAPAAELILYHHLPWQRQAEIVHCSAERLRLANLIYLADRVDILVDPQQEVLSQSERVCQQIAQGGGTLFEPESVEAFLRLARRESFWFDLCSHEIDRLLPPPCSQDLVLDGTHLRELARLFSRVIDFRSRYTALHSSGVAACAGLLAQKMGMDDHECDLMRLAGYLHDLGKVAVPREILEKRSKLDPEEYALVKRHTYYSFHLLKSIPEFEQINEWISYHHECPSGEGYPFHVPASDLSLGARIVAVADVFSAITEPRPYREVMDYRQAKAVLDEMVEAQQLDAEVVAVLMENYYQHFETNAAARREARKEYALFDQQLRWFAASDYQ